MGVPFMTGFIRALPMVQPPAPTHASARFPSRHFDVVRAGQIKQNQRASYMKSTVPLPRNGFVNIRHKCQQLMIYVTATARCTHQHVGSDIIVQLKNVAFQFHFSDGVHNKGKGGFRISDFRSPPFFVCSCVYKICFGLLLIHKPTNSITFSSDITAPKGKMSIYGPSSSLVRQLACVFVKDCCVFACLVLAVCITPVLARLWSLAFLCTTSACGVPCLLPVCVRGSLA